jgi:hypothetical protein
VLQPIIKPVNRAEKPVVTSISSPFRYQRDASMGARVKLIRSENRVATATVIPNERKN